MEDKHVVYKPTGVCSQEIQFDLVNGYVHNVHFTGGCTGNTQGVAILCEGVKAEELARRLINVNCRNGNSCPHQLALAIKQAMGEE